MDNVVQIKELQDVRQLITKGQEWIIENAVFFTRSGSHLYGTNHRDSDEDFVGITIPPIDYWVGTKRFDQFLYKDDHLDITIYDIRKYLKLAIASNPNIIEFLFVDKDNPNLIYWHSIWDKVREIRDKLVSQKAYHTFKGYSHSQLQKLRNKNSNKPSRQKIVENLGFDTKFAMHTWRLIEEGIELLTTGKIKFPRPNAPFLCDIRNGKIWKGDEIELCIAHLEAEQSKLDRILKDIALPYSGDHERLNDFQVSLFFTSLQLNLNKE